MSFSSEEKNKQLAAFLKEQRINQQLTLEEMVVKTGVPEYHLKAIELGTFEKFDQFYLRMYLKKYASVLDINPDELLEQYTNTKPTPTSSPQSPVKPKSVPKRTKTSFSLIMVIMGSLVVGGLGLVLVFGRGESPETPEPDQLVIDNPNSNELLPREEEPEVDALDEEEKQPENDLIDDEVVNVETEVTLESAGNSQSIYNVKTTNEIVKLKLTFNEPCWLAITQSNQNLVDATIYETEDTIEIELVDMNSEILLNIGNINATTITINEVAIESELTVPHQYITIKFE